MAAVILVLAEDIGDTYRGPFVDAVVRAIDALTNEDDNVAMNPQSGAPALTVTGMAARADASSGGCGGTASGGQGVEDMDIDVSISRDEGDVPAPPSRGGMPTVIGTPSMLPSRGKWGGGGGVMEEVQRQLFEDEQQQQGQAAGHAQQQRPSSSAQAPARAPRKLSDLALPPPAAPQPPPLPPSRDIYLLVAGSKRHASHLNVHDAIPANLATGGTFDRQTHRSEWDRAWTSGEQVFGDIINGVGIDKFGPRTNLWAQLLDVGKDAHGMGVLEELGREVELALRRKWCEGVSVVYMLVPPRSMRGEDDERKKQTAGSSSSEPERHLQLVQDMELGRIKQIFETVWARGADNDRQGIMRQARIEFVTSTKYQK